MRYAFVLATAWTLWAPAAQAQSPVAFSGEVGIIHLLTPGQLDVAMDNYAERRATAVLFLSSRDDGTDASAEAIRAMNTQFRRQGVLLVGVFPNVDETPAEVRAYAQSRGFIFPVYLDSRHEAVQRLGARVTPESFLIDRTGKLVYHGSINDLSASLAAFVAGSAIQPTPAEVKGTPIGKQLPARRLEDPYGAVEFSSELIFESIPGYPAHHCSSITEAPNGDLLVSWYGGSYESADDQVLFLARRRKGVRSWSKPEIVVSSPGKPPGNAILFTDKRKRVWLIWGRMDGTQPMRRGTGWDACELFYRTSADSGATWSEDKPFYHDTLGWLPRNLPIFLADGTLVVPISDERNGHGVDLSFFLASKDDGSTWTQSGIMQGGEQPTFIERADGTMLAYLRTRPNIKASESHDHGKTWSEPLPTQWKNPDSGISMRRLANGHVFLVFNNQDNSRSPLHIARSVDEARNWDKPLELESNPGEYSYPSILQSSDGKIHIVYTFRRYSIKHVELNEGWLEHLQRPN